MLTRLVLAVIWLWTARFLSVTADQEGKGMAEVSKVFNDQMMCMEITEYSNTMWLMCTFESDMYNTIMLNCSPIDEGNRQCTLLQNITVNVDCENVCDSVTDDSSKEPCSPEPTPTVTTSSEPSQSDCSHESTIVAALGAVVGLLVAILALMISILIWTCWTMKKRQGINISRKDRNGVDQLTNPTYAEGDNMLSIQPAASPTAMPAYETIALNPRVNVTLSENGEHDYHVLERGQGSSSCAGSGLETIHEDELESSYSKLQLAEKEEEEEREGGGVKKERDHQYGNLEMLELDMVKVDEANSGRQESDTVINGENGGLQLESIDAGTDSGEKDVEMESHIILLTTTTTDNTGTDTTRNTIETGGLKPSTSLEIIHP